MDHWPCPKHRSLAEVAETEELLDKRGKTAEEAARRVHLRRREARFNPALSRKGAQRR